MTRMDIDGFAGWAFGGVQPEMTHQEFLDVDKQAFLNSLEARFHNLLIALECLLEHKLFLSQWLIFDKLSIDVEAKSPSEIIAEIKKVIQFHPAKEFAAFFIEGKALIKKDQEYQWINPAFTILYESGLDLMTIETVTDAWMPIDVDSDFWSILNLPPTNFIDIDRAIFNASRLEKALLEIKAKGVFQSISPDENEISTDYMCIQQGFRMYYDKRGFEESEMTEEMKNELVRFIYQG